MTDPTYPSRKALFDRLSASFPPAGVGVHSRAPDASTPPVVIIGDIALGLPLTKDGTVFEVVAEIITVVEGRSPGPAEEIMGWVFGALHLAALPTTSGTAFTPPLLTASAARSNEEKTAFFGLQTFTFTASN